jgi:hypothetical protein
MFLSWCHVLIYYISLDDASVGVSLNKEYVPTLAFYCRLTHGTMARVIRFLSNEVLTRWMMKYLRIAFRQNMINSQHAFQRIFIQLFVDVDDDWQQSVRGFFSLIGKGVTKLYSHYKYVSSEKSIFNNVFDFIFNRFLLLFYGPILYILVTVIHQITFFDFTRKRYIWLSHAPWGHRWHKHRSTIFHMENFQLIHIGQNSVKRL